MLIFVKLLDVQQGVLVLRVELDDLVERFERAVDEAAALEIEAQAEQHVSMFEAGQARPLQKALMDVDRARDLPLFTIQAAEQQMDLERVAEILGGLAQLVDGEIDLIGHEEIQSDDVVERFGHTPAIDQAARPQLVALPRFPDRQPDEQRDRARRGTDSRRSKQLCPPEVVQMDDACDGLALPPTTSDVILRCSMMSSAWAASVDGSITIGRLVMTSPAVISSSRLLSTMKRRRSPSVMMPDQLVLAIDDARHAQRLCSTFRSARRASACRF